MENEKIMGIKQKERESEMLKLLCFTVQNRYKYRLEWDKKICTGKLDITLLYCYSKSPTTTLYE